MKEIKFKIRASAVHQIMTSARSKSEILGDTAKTYCKNWLKGQIFDRQADFSNVYTEKGLINEDEAIDMVAKHFGYSLLIKNLIGFNDHPFLKGTPDILPGNDSKVIDVKNSWSWETFPLLETELPNRGYEMQIKAYMELTGRDEGYVVYCLTDTPENLIERVARRKCYDQGYDDLDIDVYNTIHKNMNYSDIPVEYKIKVFGVMPDLEFISQVEERVSVCREYLNSLCLMNNLSFKII